MGVNILRSADESILKQRLKCAIRWWEIKLWQQNQQKIYKEPIDLEVQIETVLFLLWMDGWKYTDRLLIMM